MGPILGFLIGIFCLVLATPVRGSKDNESQIMRSGLATPSDKRLVQLAEEMGSEKSLKLPSLSLDFKQNFKNIPSLEENSTTLGKYIVLLDELSKIARKNISPGVVFLYESLDFEIERAISRLKRERAYVLSGANAPQGNFSQIPKNKAWYRIYQRAWISDELTPGEVSKFGREEVERIRFEISKIQNRLGFKGKSDDFRKHLQSKEFFFSNIEEIEKKYQTIHKKVVKNVKKLFLNVPFEPVAIKRDPNSNSKYPPGFYTDKTFYFNFFGAPYNWRAMDWLYIHEAIPGHHFQTYYKIKHPAPMFASTYGWQPGFSEGWGAYAESLGYEVGLYSNIYSLLGKWEWDLIRSARLVLDVGLNYHGKSRKWAEAYWSKNVLAPDSIRDREIDRILRWPVQVLSYKMGEKVIRELRRESEYRAEFDVRVFHEEILSRGALSLPALRKLPFFN